MTDDVLANIRTLETELQANPDSQSIREELLREYVRARLVYDARHIVHVVEYVRRFPRTSMARCPLVQMDAEVCPEGFAAVEHEWLKHQSEHPTDAQIARGLAVFLADTDPERAMRLLREAQKANPEEAELITDAARLCEDPVERLGLFQQARSVGSSHPNLRVWIAQSAIDAADLDAAEIIAKELFESVANLRSRHGERLEWTEQGAALWARARSDCDDDESARELVTAINNHSNWTHWGHTTLGVVSARRGDVTAAREHMRASAKVVGDFRLRSYGPSFRLACEVLERGEWAAVADYLRECQTFWDSDDLREWISQVEQNQHPDFPDQ